MAIEIQGEFVGFEPISERISRIGKRQKLFIIIM